MNTDIDYYAITNLEYQADNLIRSNNTNKRWGSNIASASGGGG